MSSPPGANRVILVKRTSFKVNKDSRKEIPVSLAPTTIILVLFRVFLNVSSFLEIMLNANGGSC